MKYELKELTENCMAGACQKVYDLKELTESCLVGACQTVFSGKETYVIIGKKITPEKLASLGLERKIGNDETIIEIDKSILDKVFKP